MSDEEIGITTPREYAKLVETLHEREQRDYWRSGLVTSMVANVNRGKNQRAFKPDDFMPKLSKKKRKPQTWQDQLSIVKGIQASMGG